MVFKNGRGLAHYINWWLVPTCVGKIWNFGIGSMFQVAWAVCRIYSFCLLSADSIVCYSYTRNHIRKDRIAKAGNGFHNLIGAFRRKVDYKNGKKTKGEISL